MAIAVGCGGSAFKPPRTAGVSGVVYLDGKPLNGVEVHFIHETFTAYGKTNAEGRYELVQGAVPGTNKVYFSKIRETGIKLDPEAGIDEEQLRAMASAQGTGPGAVAGGDLIPAEYSDPTKTKITFDVPDGGTDSADFRLSSS